MLYKSETDATAAADQANAAPLKEGQEKRSPYKVYEVEKDGMVRGFLVGQTPTTALGAVYDELGIKLRRVDNEKLPTIDEYIKKLSPEQVEAVKKLLAGK